MNKKSIIITLGVLIALMPLFGFPGGVKDVFFILAGLTIALLEIVLTSRVESDVNMFISKSIKNKSDVNLRHAESFKTPDKKEEEKKRDE
jgi:hypothetical protein